MNDAGEGGRYPPIGDYGLISDCHAAALVSRTGSIDWCCMPRLDDGSAFGRLLDWDRGGHCTLRPTDKGDVQTSRAYLDNTMVLETVFRTSSGEARLVDCFAIHDDDAQLAHPQLMRVIEGIRGTVTFQAEIQVRFDYGDVKPWIRFHRPGLWSAVGGNDALLISADVDLDVVGHHDLVGEFTVRSDERARLVLSAHPPEALDRALPRPPAANEIDQQLASTLEWWREWAAHVEISGRDAAAATRSALVLKALTNASTGATAAAATTSLPEFMGGGRNWDYRFSWIRDSQFTVRALAEVGCDAVADGLRRFLERSAAGGADSLQIVYGLGGERRITELELDLEGYRGSSPVRVGNAACEQVQLDVYGELLNLAWKWHQRGRSPDDDYWRFLLSLVDTAAQRWAEPDHGIWEMRGRARHFVHSKVMCWVALDRGLKLAEQCLRQAPTDQWSAIRSEIRCSIERDGMDQDRNCFVQHYGTKQVDAALLLLPTVDFVSYDDPRMVATTEAVMADLDRDGLLQRYGGSDGLDGEEGAFVACSFWLAECLAFQGSAAEARRVYDRAISTANDLGLHAEEYDPATGELLGNYPQALTHLSQIAAAVALAHMDPPVDAPT